MRDEVAIPYEFLSINTNSKKRDKKFREHVEQYILANHPGYQLQTIKKMTAIIYKGE